MHNKTTIVFIDIHKVNMSSNHDVSGKKPENLKIKQRILRNEARSEASINNEMEVVTATKDNDGKCINETSKDEEENETVDNGKEDQIDNETNDDQHNQDDCDLKNEREILLDGKYDEIDNETKHADHNEDDSDGYVNEDKEAETNALE